MNVDRLLQGKDAREFACSWASTSARLTCRGVEGGEHHAVCDLLTKIVEDLVDRVLYLSPPSGVEQENSALRMLLKKAQEPPEECPDWCGQELVGGRVLICDACAEGWARATAAANAGGASGAGWIDQ